MLETLVPSFESSSDSKKAILIASWLITLAWLQGFRRLVLTPEHRALVSQWFRDIDHQVPEVASITALALIFAGVAFYLLALHESFYDRLFVRWRHRHDADFVLARLFGPFRDVLIPGYHEILKANARALTVRIFCPFVSGKGTRLDGRFVRSFYHALTLYWIAQIIEIGILGWLVAAIIYSAWGRWTGAVSVEWQASLLFKVFIVLAVGIANNLLLVRASRRAVRVRTQHEIDEIFRYYQSDLEQLVLETSPKFGLLLSSVSLDNDVSGEKVIVLPTPTIVTDSRIVYISSPMASHSEAEYVDDRQLMLKLATILKENCGFSEVIYAGTGLPVRGGAEDKFLALEKNLRCIRKSGVFIFHYPARLPSSALFELGYALALGKKILLFVRSHNHLPFLLRAAAQMDRITEHVYKTEDELLGLVRAGSETLFGHSPSPTAT